MTLIGEGSGAASTITHGTGTIHTKEFVVDMRDKIYRLDPAQNPFLVFSNLFPKVTAYNYKYEWMEREGFTRRTLIGTWIKKTVGADTVLGVQLNARDWNAIAFIGSDITAEADAAGMVRMVCKVSEAGVAGDSYVGHIKRSAYINGHTKRKLYNEAGVGTTEYFQNAIQLSKDAAQSAANQYANRATVEADLIFDNSEYTASLFTWFTGGVLTQITDGAKCFIVVEYPNMQAKGYRQGSGLGKEQKKISNWYYNYTQIFKTPVSVTGTMQACRTIGGDERMRRQFENGQSHASDLEYSFIFQGGGIEGSGGDWGIVENYENPKTRFKGLGVGHESGKEGWIVTNNGNPYATGVAAGGDCQITTGEMDDYIKFLERLYDDMKQGTPNKVMFTSTAFIKDMTKLAKIGTANSYLTLSASPAYAGVIGLNITRVNTPFGTLDMVLHPMFTGPYRRYGLVLDMKNIAIRPLNGRDTKLHVNVSSGEIDGIVDEYRTEVGIEVRAENTHAIAYLDGSID